MKAGFTTAKESAVKLAPVMYEGEPCRVCGENISDATKAVYAGYSAGNEARSAHKSCWEENTPKSLWAYPQDSK